MPLSSKPKTRDESSGRRPRRRTEEVRELILNAARAVIAEQGIKGASTRTIAARADVAEQLIFKHFSNKEILFEKAIVAPFHEVLRQLHRETEKMPPNRKQRSIHIIHRFYPFLVENSNLLHALVKSSDYFDKKLIHGLDGYFSRAARQMRIQYDVKERAFDVAPELIARYAFAMVAGSVLLHEWLFPDSEIGEEESINALIHLLTKITAPSRD